MKDLENYITPEDKKLLYDVQLIRTLIDLNQNHAAVILLTDLLKIHKTVPLLYHLRGQALLEEGNAEAALTDFQKAIKLDPDLQPSLYYLGQLYVQRTDLEEAHRIFKKLEKMDPSNPSIYHFLGLIAHMKNEKEKAVRYWQKALRLNPHFSPAIYNLKLYNIQTEETSTLQENLEEAYIVDQKKKIEEKIRSIEVVHEIKHDPYELFVGNKGVVWLANNTNNAFTFLGGKVNVQVIEKSKVKELVKILQSVIVRCAHSTAVDNIFWELDFGKGQYFIYYRHKINEFQWDAYHEGRFQSKKVPIFFKFRINSSVQIDDLLLNGNVFLIESKKKYYVVENLGTPLSYNIIDSLDMLNH